MATTLGNVSDIFGAGEGYAPSFGTTSTFTPELAPAGTTSSFFTSGGGLGFSGLAWSISGNQESSLAALTHVKIGGTNYAVTSGPTYDGSTDTAVYFNTVPRFTIGATYPGIELVGLGGGDTTAPTITSASSVNNTEGNTLSHALTANESVTWSIVGGADQADFEISGSTMRWASNGVQDYDSPADADANNTYIVTVRATDGASNTTDQTITVTVLQAYAGPTYVAKSTASGGTSAISISFASLGRTTGDKLVIGIASANEAITAPSGFTEIANSPQSRGTAAAAGGIRLAVFQANSEDIASDTVSIADSGNHTYAVGIVLRKSALDNLEITATAGNNVAATTSGTFGGVTTTGDHQMVVTFVGTDRDSTAASWSGEANANLGNLTERHDAGTTSGVGSGIAVYTGEKLTAGATGNTTATQAASSAYCWITLALGNAADVVNHATTGTLTGQIGSVVGSAARTRAHATSGAPIGQIGSVAGTAAHIAIHSTSGSLTGQIGSVSGVAARTRVHASTGVLTGQIGSVSGVAARTRAHDTAGVLPGQSGVVSGTAARTRDHSVSGILTGQGSTLAGVARHNVPHDTSGSITGPGSVLAGVSSRFRAFASSGSLVATGATISGDAERIVGAVSHATTGALIGAGSSLSGAATRFRAFAASGSLAGQGSSITGSAARADGFVTHDASGSLIGHASQIDGAAIRYRVHAASGSLAGAGSSIAGASARFRALSTSGNLIGSGSVIDGIAVRSRVFFTSGNLVGPHSSIDGIAVQYAAHDASGVLTGGGSIVIGDALRSGNIPVPDFLNCRFSYVEPRIRFMSVEYRNRAVPVESRDARIFPVEVRGATMLPVDARLRIVPIEARVRVVPVEATCD